ncbi:MAG TPA: hypoxanthine-guanine phosphoribosyltransferase [Gammaproteobacteria bacterium]
MRDDRLADAVEARRRARRLLSAPEVDAVYDRMAGDIAALLAGANPVVVAVMHGGVFTAIELCRRFEFPYDFAYVHPTRYGHELTGGELDWKVEPKPELKGRTVLIVDDILDGGVTLGELERSMRSLGIERLYKAVFAIKALARPAVRPSVDFEGVHVEDVYVFGCGMDYRGYWRGLPELLAVDAPKSGT